MIIDVFFFTLYRATNRQFVAVCAAPSDVETSSKDESVLITKVETENSNEVKVCRCFCAKETSYW
jgi:hypothetical protein